MTDDRSKKLSDTGHVLAKISLHLDMLADRVLVLEEAVCHGFSSRTDALDANSLTELQSLDFVRQSLQDVALLVHLLDAYTPEQVQSAFPVDDFMTKLKLKITKNLLISPNDEDKRERFGEVDFF